MVSCEFGEGQFGCNMEKSQRGIRVDDSVLVIKLVQKFKKGWGSVDEENWKYWKGIQEFLGFGDGLDVENEGQ